jgi:UPF0716 family protein affecting phage T7 exclusion
MNKRASTAGPYRLTTVFLVLSRIVGAVFDRPPGFATIFRRMNKRASTAGPYRLTTVFLVLSRIVGAVFDRPPGFATIFRRMNKQASTAGPYKPPTFAVYAGEHSSQLRSVAMTCIVLDAYAREIHT